MSSGVGGAGPGSWSHEVTGVAGQSAMRTWIRDCITSASGPDRDDMQDLIGDVMVVASELVTNALEHGGAIGVQVELSVGDVVSVVVAYEGRRPPATDASAAMPTPSESRGRGLSIVRALTSSYRVETHPPRVTRTVCEIPVALAGS